MKYIVVLPDHLYFQWMALVQCTNFREIGIEEDVIFISCYFGEVPSPTLSKLANSPELKCKWYLYKDERPSKNYTSSMRLHLLYRFWCDHPEMATETICYIDPDVVFTQKPDWSKYMNDNVWYVSECTSYTDSKYIRSKGEDIFEEMCNIVHVDKQKVIDHDQDSGGVQYFMRNVSQDFWWKCYWDAEKMYKRTREMGDAKTVESRNSINKKLVELIKEKGRGLTPEEKQEFDKNNPLYHRLQEWATDLYVLHYNAIYFNRTFKIDKYMSFSWAGWQRKDWHEHLFHHSAGVVKENGRDFCKITHQRSAFKKEIIVSPESCSYPYVELIKRTAIEFKELIWD